jgi:hypothetical protein
MREKLTESQLQMLQDLSVSDDPDSWCHFDPPFPVRTSDSLVRRGLILVRNGDEFQLTEAGHTALVRQITA